MKSIKPLLFVVLFLSPLFLVPYQDIQAESPYVPEQLEPWVKWVKDGNPNWKCSLKESNRVCVWPGELSLSLYQDGGHFTFTVTVEKETRVPLPGGDGVWPQQIKDRLNNTKTIVTVVQNKKPYALLGQGKHKLSGNFAWKRLPKSITVPVHSALVKLNVEGKDYHNPLFNENGLLWLHGATSEIPKEIENDRLTAQIYRKIVDDLPFKVITQLDLRVSGRVREINFGNILTSGSTPVGIKSPLNYRMDSQYNLFLQVRPGKYNVRIESLYDTPPDKLSPEASDSPAGLASKEFWVWKAAPELRSVEVSGLTGIDAKRVSLPGQWQSLPAYVASKESNLTLKEVKRGQTDLPPNSLKLSRQIWLDLDGVGFTIKDQVTGTMNKDWRLNAAKDLKLGHVKVSGVDQLITSDDNTGLAGVEVRDHSVNLTAESRLEKTRSSLPAVGWDFDVQSLNASLSLPPGWKLLGASGVDNLSHSWLSSWTLLDFFFVLIIVFATGKILGIRWSVVAAIVLVLGQGETGSPRLIWVHLLTAKALLEVLPDGAFRKAVKVYFYSTLGALALIVIPFSVSQIRGGLFPQISRGFSTEAGPAIILYELIEEALLAWPLVLALFGGVIFLFKREFRWGLGLMVCSFLGLFLAGLFTVGSMRQNTVPMVQTKQSANQRVQTAIDHMEMERYEDKSYRGKRLSSVLSESNVYPSKMKSFEQVDPHAIVQTGPGVPDWSWRSWNLRWNGPVDKAHRIKLCIIGPYWNLLLSIARIIAVFALAIAFIKALPHIKLSAAPTAFGLLMLISPEATYAQDFPDRELLRELGNRISREQCRKDCTSTEKIILNLIDNEIIIEATVLSKGSGAWSIPGPAKQFLPDKVEIDGKPTTALRREKNGMIWTRVPDGKHKITALGSLPDRNIITLQFGLPANHVEVHAPAWSVDGVSETGSVSASIQITRKSQAEEKPGSDKIDSGTETFLPEWFFVERNIVIGIPWTVRTTVRRSGNLERPVIKRFPLLSNESVNSENVRLEGSKAILSFSRGKREISWESVLSEQPELQLAAGGLDNSSQSWILACTPIWKCTYSGVPPVSTLTANKHITTWRPYPGEKVEIEINKPAGEPGKAATIDKVVADYRPGTRLWKSKLELSVRSSQGGWQKVVIPENASVENVLVNGAEKIIRPEKGKLLLPLTPGSQKFVINWSIPYDPLMLARAPSVTVEGGAVNLRTNITIPRDRWILLAGGPKWGPVVLFWSKLILIGILALLLVRIPRTPLSLTNWILLLLGLTTMPVPLMLIPVVWFFSITAREKNPPERRGLFNLMQVGLGALTLLVMAIFYYAIHKGLILYPDMQISGCNSYYNTLKWYVDSSSASLPRPWVLTAPIWVWRIIMLLWASWLAYSLLKWLPWAWKAFSSESLWKSKENAKG